MEKSQMSNVNNEISLVLYCFTQKLSQNVYEMSIDELLRNSEIIFPLSKRVVCMKNSKPFIKYGETKYNCCICGIESKYTDDIACPYHFVLARKINELIIYTCSILYNHIRLYRTIQNDSLPFIYEYRIMDLKTNKMENIIIDIFNEKKYKSIYDNSVFITIKNRIKISAIPKYILSQFLSNFNKEYCNCSFSNALYN